MTYTGPTSKHLLLRSAALSHSYFSSFHTSFQSQHTDSPCTKFSSISVGFMGSAERYPLLSLLAYVGYLQMSVCLPVYSFVSAGSKHRCLFHMLRNFFCIMKVIQDNCRHLKHINKREIEESFREQFSNFEYILLVFLNISTHFHAHIPFYIFHPNRNVL